MNLFDLLEIVFCAIIFVQKPISFGFDLDCHHIAVQRPISVAPSENQQIPELLPVRVVDKALFEVALIHTKNALINGKKSISPDSQKRSI